MAYCLYDQKYYKILYPLETHFVHATKDGKLAVVAVMFKNGRANPILGGSARNIWGISCEKSRCYANKSYFFQF
jgi:carbonic anhydrase